MYLLQNKITERRRDRPGKTRDRTLEYQSGNLCPIPCQNRIKARRLNSMQGLCMI